MVKRIVLEETQGPRAGLRHIMGCDDEVSGPLPDLVDPVEIIDRVSAASLIQSKARYVLYREVLKNGVGESPEAQNPNIDTAE